MVDGVQEDGAEGLVAGSELAVVVVPADLAGVYDHEALLDLVVDFVALLGEHGGEESRLGVEGEGV